MFRDKIIEHMDALKEKMGLTRRTIDEMHGELVGARAVSLDAKADVLIQGYIDKLPDDSLRDALATMRLPWPRLWMEHYDDQGTINGILVTQEDGRTSCQLYTADLFPDTVVMPPLFRLDLNKDAAAFRLHPTDVGKIITAKVQGSPECHTDLERLMDRQVVTAQEQLLVAAVLSVLLEARDILEIEEGAPLPRAMRRRIERTGRPLPERLISKIDLGRIGRIEHAAMTDEAGGDRDGTGAGEATGRRRTHWVRGHMFIARNRQLTYRRPHMRGTGPAPESLCEVTASNNGIPAL